MTKCESFVNPKTEPEPFSPPFPMPDLSICGRQIKKRELGLLSSSVLPHLCDAEDCQNSLQRSIGQ